MSRPAARPPSYCRTAERMRRWRSNPENRAREVARTKARKALHRECRSNLQLQLRQERARLKELFKQWKREYRVKFYAKSAAARAKRPTLRHMRIAAGRCPECGGQPVPGRKRCAKHLAAAAAASSRAQLRKKAEVAS